MSFIRSWSQCLSHGTKKTFDKPGIIARTFHIFRIFSSVSVASELTLARLPLVQSKNWLYVYSAKMLALCTIPGISSDTNCKAPIWVSVDRLLIRLWLISDEPSVIKMICQLASNVLKTSFFIASYSLSSNIAAKVVALGTFQAEFRRWRSAWRYCPSNKFRTLPSQYIAIAARWLHSACFLGDIRRRAKEVCCLGPQSEIVEIVSLFWWRWTSLTT